jgi:hypothetical protein
LSTDRNLGKRRAHLGIEPIAVHAEVAWRIAQPDKAGNNSIGASRVPNTNRNGLDRDA